MINKRYVSLNGAIMGRVVIDLEPEYKQGSLSHTRCYASFTFPEKPILMGTASEAMWPLRVAAFACTLNSRQFTRAAVKKKKHNRGRGSGAKRKQEMLIHVTQSETISPTIIQ